MQIVAVTDPLQLGFPRQAMIGLRTDGDLEAVADRLAEFDEIDYVVITAGSFDLLAEVVLPQRRATCWRSCSGCAPSTGCSPPRRSSTLKLRKQTYSWGTA